MSNVNKSKKMQASQVRTALTNSRNFDADVRTVAMWDLTKEVLKNNGALIENQLQVPIRDAVIERLQDKSSDVQVATTKFLSHCCMSLASDQLCFIARRLAEWLVQPVREPGSKRVLDDDEVSRILADKRTFGEAINTVLQNVEVDTGNETAPMVAVFVLDRLAKTKTKQAKEATTQESDIEMVCLDVLKVCLDRYHQVIIDPASATPPTSSQLQDPPSEALAEAKAAAQRDIPNLAVTTLKKLLSNSNRNIRLRSADTMASCVNVLSEEQFTDLIQFLSKNKESIYVVTTGHICKVAGMRVAPYLEKVVPRLLSSCDALELEDDNVEAAELCEVALVALYSVFAQCSLHVDPFVDAAVAACLRLSSYDPLFIARESQMDLEEEPEADGGWGDDDDGGWGANEDGEEDAGWAEQTDYKVTDEELQKNDDESWKVRRAAISAVDMFVRQRSDLVTALFDDILGCLVRRFSDRELNVKELVMHSTSSLLLDTVAGAGADKSSISSPTAMDVDGKSMPKLSRQRSTFGMMERHTPALIAACERELQSNQTRAQTAAFKVLESLASVQQSGSLAQILTMVLPHVETALKPSPDTNNKQDQEDYQLQQACLKFLVSYLSYHSYDTFRGDSAAEKAFQVLVKCVLLFAKDAPLSVTADMLMVLRVIAARLKGSPTFKRTVNTMYTIIFKKMRENDVPEGIKIVSLTAMTILMSHFGDQSKGDSKSAKSDAPTQANLIAVFRERLGNKATRLTAVDGLIRVAESKGFDLSDFLEKDLERLCEFLRQADREFSQRSARLLCILVASHANAVSKNHLNAIVARCKEHLVEQAGLGEKMIFLLAAGVLDILSACLQHVPGAPALIGKEIVPEVLNFLNQPLVHGSALDSAISFFMHCVESGEDSLNYATQFAALSKLVKADSKIEQIRNVAGCVAGISCLPCSTDALANTVKRFGLAVNSRQAHQGLFALYSLGQIGARTDLTGQSELQSAILQLFEHKQEDRRKGAAYALGNMCSQSGKGLSNLLELFGKNERHSLLLLTSLKEALQAATRTGTIDLQAHIERVAGILNSFAAHTDSDVRATVTDCFGRLCAADPGTVLPLLGRMTSPDSSELHKMLALTAIRMGMGSLTTDWSPLEAIWASVLATLKLDDQPLVKRQTIMTIKAAVQRRPELFPRTELVRDVLPGIYAEVKVREELIETKAYGELIEEKVDHGIEVRIVAVDCLTAIYRTFHGVLDVSKLIQALIENVLTDTNVVMQAGFQLVFTICEHSPEEMVQFLDELPNILFASIKTNMKLANTTGGDQMLSATHAQSTLKTILFAFEVFAHLPGSDKCTKFITLHKRIGATASLLKLRTEVQQIYAAGESL